MDLNDLPESLREFAVLMIIIIGLLTFDFFYANPTYLYVILGVAVLGFGIYFYMTKIKPTMISESSHKETFDSLNDNNGDKNKSADKFVIDLKNKLKSFRPISSKNYNESALEAQLYQYLLQAFPNRTIAYQSSAKSGRVDLVIDKKWAIELKLASSKKQLETAFLQFIKYAEEFDYLFVLVHDVNKKLQKSDVKTLIKECKKSGRYNVDFIIVH